MGRIPEVESQTVVRYGLGYIRPYHREIARRLVLGERAVDISKSLGMGQERLSIIVNSPLFKLEVKRLEEMRDNGVADVQQTLREISPIALEVIERTMHSSKSEALKFAAAQDVLDRAGFGKTTKVISNVSGNITHSNMSEAELRQLVVDRVQRIKDEAELRAKELRDADAIEVGFEEVNPGDGSTIEQSGGKINVAFV